MDIGGLMVSTSNSRWDSLGSFPGRDSYKFDFQLFWGSNEGIIGREAEMRGSMVKCVEDR